MRTKEEFLNELIRRQNRIPQELLVQDYLRRCIELMFELTAEVLEEVKNAQTSEYSKAVPPGSWTRYLRRGPFRR